MHVVLENAEVTTRLMGLDDARASGARALFGEKYGDEVRVVSMGEIEDAEHHERTYSIELCGGTHVHRTGDIGLITIVGESAVAAGVRRIEAKTRDEARKWLEADSRGYADLTALLRAPCGRGCGAAGSADRRQTQARARAGRRQAQAGDGRRRRTARTDAARDVAGVKLYARAVSGVDMKDLKSLADEAKQSVGSGVVAIAAASEDGKASIVVAVTPDLTSRFNAVDLVRLGSAALGGKGGGGRPDMAQAGGPDGARTHEALAAVEEGVRRAAGAKHARSLTFRRSLRMGGRSGAQSRQFVASDVPNERRRQRRILVTNDVANIANADPADIGMLLFGRLRNRATCFGDNQ